MTSNNEINIPEKLYEANLNGKIIFIRHGENESNVSFKKIGIYETERNIKFLDAPLTEKGLKEAEEAGKNYINFEIEGAYVSPLQRTLQTATELFKNHPQKDKIIFIVHPLITEGMVGVNEMIYNIDALKQKFNMNSIVKFDWSVFDKFFPTKIEQNLYFLNNINNYDSNLVNPLKEKIVMSFGTDEYLINLEKLLSLLEKDKPLESAKHIWKRFQDFKMFIKNKHKDSLNDISKKIVIVSHRLLGSISTSRKAFLSKDITSYPDDGYKLSNCEGFTMLWE